MIVLIFANISLLGSYVCFAMNVVNAFFGKRACLYEWKKSQCCQQNLAKEVQTLPISLRWKSHVLQYFRIDFFLSILRWGKLATAGVCMSDLREGVRPSKWGIYLCEWWGWGGVYRASIKQSEEISVLQLLQLSCVAPTEAINISNINIIFGRRLVVTTVHMMSFYS